MPDVNEILEGLGEENTQVIENNPNPQETPPESTTTEDSGNPNDVNQNEEVQNQNSNEEGEETQDADDKTQSNSVIRDMRNRIAELNNANKSKEELLELVAKNLGVSTEKLRETIQAKQDEKDAEANKVPVEIQKQIREQQAKLNEVLEGQRRQVFVQKIQQLQADVPGLSSEDLKQFVQEASKAGFDIVQNPNLNATQVYRALNYQKIEQSIRESERQKVYEEIKKQGSSGNVTTVRNQSDGKTASTINDVLSKLV